MYRFNNHFHYFFILVVMLFSFKGNTQAPASDKASEYKKHFVHVELAGRTFLFGSMNYEYKFKKPFSLGVGLGLINIGSGDITRSNNGVSEAGRFFDLTTTQMIYGNYFMGKKKKLFLTTGVTNFLIFNRNSYPSVKERSYDSHLRWSAGIGYQFLFDKAYLRITAYGISLVKESFLLPKYLPWIGIAVGVRK